ncbi:MAG: hypothetical protein ISR96_04345 [Nitrospira sp.]|nr:hypothetical protein [bacterium]MBL7048735.1 hypothetical protein [Nitrospira sp.]
MVKEYASLKYGNCNTMKRLSAVIYAVLVLSGIAVIAGMLFSHYTVGKIRTGYAPLSQSVHQIKQEVTVAHLWLEEALVGDNTKGIDAVLKHVETAESKNESLLSGENAGLIAADAALRGELLRIRESLKSFHLIANDRHMLSGTAAAGSVHDLNYDNVYEGFIQNVQNIEFHLQHKINISYSVFGLTQYLTAFFLIIFAGSAMLVALHYRGGRDHAMSDLKGVLIKDHSHADGSPDLETPVDRASGADVSGVSQG